MRRRGKRTVLGGMCPLDLNWLRLMAERGMTPFLVYRDDAGGQHIQVLEDSGLVHSEKVGRVRTCRIDGAALQPAERWMAERRIFWERSLDRLGDYLGENPEAPTREE